MKKIFKTSILLLFLLLSCRNGSNTNPPDDPGEDQLANPMLESDISRQYYLNHIGDIYSVWKSYQGKDITIAVIDAGFNPQHPDFYDKDGVSKVLATSASFSVKSDGTVKEEIGVDKVVNMGESHGTFCAGVAAGSINEKGIIGIAPLAKLLLLKTDLRPKSIAKAFRYAADNGARVITISIGSYYNYDGDLINDGSDLAVVFNDAINYCYNKGVVVVSAGGNGGLDNQPTEYTFPGCLDHVIGVGGLASNSSKEIWSGSSYNSSASYQFIDVLAPSEDMYGCCHYDNKLYDNGWNGTSFASPIVAGLAALYFDKYPTCSNIDFERDLYASCHNMTSSTIARADQLGYGRVDALKLLGEENEKYITAYAKSTSSTMNAYIWNSLTGNALCSWPGLALEKVDGLFACAIDTTYYDSVIFSHSGSQQTVDISASSFTYKSIYDLTNPVIENGLYIGKYIPLP